MVLIALICVIDLDLQQQQIKLSFEQHDKIASYCKAQKREQIVWYVTFLRKIVKLCNALKKSRKNVSML